MKSESQVATQVPIISEFEKESKVIDLRQKVYVYLSANTKFVRSHYCHHYTLQSRVFGSIHCLGSSCVMERPTTGRTFRFVLCPPVCLANSFIIHRAQIDQAFDSNTL